MPSHTDTVGHTVSVFTQSWTTGGKVKVLRPEAHSNHIEPLSVHSRTCQPPYHTDRPKSEDQNIYRGTQRGGGVLFLMGRIVCHNNPATCTSATPASPSTISVNPMLKYGNITASNGEGVHFFWPYRCERLPLPANIRPWEFGRLCREDTSILRLPGPSGSTFFLGHFLD